MKQCANCGQPVEDDGVRNCPECGDRSWIVGEVARSGTRSSDSLGAYRSRWVKSSSAYGALLVLVMAGGLGGTFLPELFGLTGRWWGGAIGAGAWVVLYRIRERLRRKAQHRERERL